TPEGEDFDNTGAFKTAGQIEIRVLLDNQPIHLKAADEEPSANDFTLRAQVVAREVESITVTPPDKTSYFVGQAVDYTGGVVTAQWNDGKTEKISLTSDEVTKGAYDNTEAAVVAISVTYGGVEGMFRVTFAEPEITRIAVTTQPTDREYVEGEAFDPANGVITVYKEYGDPDVVNMTEQGVSYDDITDWAPGVYELNVQYGGKTTTVTITIVAKLINTVALSTQPAKTVYLRGEELDLADAKITVTYSNCATDDVFDLNDIRNQLAISGFRSDEPGVYTVSIIYKGKTVTYNITVKGVIEIAVNTPPTKLNYIVGQELELTGGKLDVTVAGEDEVRVIDITEDMLSDYDLSTAGDKEITVSYGGRTTSFVVHVDPLTATSIVVTAQPTRTEFYLNEDIVVAGGKITVTYNDGTTEVIDMTAAMISGYDKTKAGEQTVTVTYGGKTATFKVTVLAKTVSRIEIAATPTKLVYDYNGELDITGGKIKVIFNNGESETINMTADMISGYDKTKEGKQTITVTYAEKTASFEVTVNAKPEDKKEDEKKDDEKKDDNNNNTDDYYEFDPTVQEEPVAGEGMRIFFDDNSLVMGEDEKYHITFTGKAIKPLVRVTDNRVILTEGVDYTVSYKKNVNVGEASVIVKGKGTYSANDTLTFVIDKRSITEAEIGGMVSKNPNKAKPVVIFGGKVLKKGKDYNFVIDEGSVEFEGIGNFEGTTTEMIEELTAQELKKSGIKVKFNEDMPKEFIYDGLPQTIDEYLIVTDGTGEETGEYAVSYTDNVNAGKVTVMIIGTGSHKGKVKKSFRIKPNKTASFDVSYNAEVEYNKNGAKPFIVVSANETFELLTPGRDYSVKYRDNKTAGSAASFELKFNGNYKGAKYTGKSSFTVKQPSLDKAAANISGNYILAGDMVYSKNTKYQPKTYIVIDGSLVSAKEYELAYSETGKLSGPKDALTVTAAAKGKNYADKVSTSYNVVEGSGKTDVNKAKVKLTKSGKSKVYGGAGDEVTLTPGTDFTVTIGKTKIESAAEITANFDIFYADNNAAGKASVILKGKGNYTGVFAGNFNIKKAIIKKK
nr:bacterial Ig-like domain-containing protein [Lachnospiraceae bacterium]